MEIVPPQDPLDCIEERRAVDGFTKKGYRPHLLCLLSCRGIVAGRNYDDRQVYVACSKFRVQLFARHSGHSRVQDQTTGHIVIESVKKLVCGSKISDVVARGEQKAREPFPR